MSDPYVKQGEPELVEFTEKLKNYAFRLAPTSNWGNPWDFSLKNGFEVDSKEQALENFKKWILGEDFTDTLQVRRKWLLKNLKYLKGKKLAYDDKETAELLVSMIDRDIPLPDVEDYIGQGKTEPEKPKKAKRKSVF